MQYAALFNCTHWRSNATMHMQPAALKSFAATRVLLVNNGCCKQINTSFGFTKIHQRNVRGDQRLYTLQD